jgi:hypothetical protein
MMKKTIIKGKINMRSSVFNFIIISAFCLLNFACQNNAVETNNSTNKTANAVNSNADKPLISDFEENLKSMQISDFEYIFAFKRKDGGKFDRDDKDFLKETAPQQTNRWLLTKDETTVLAGSNFIFSPDVMKKLGTKFAIEDFSPKKLDVKEDVVYSDVLMSVVYGTNESDSKDAFEGISGNDWLTIRKETVIPENFNEVKSLPDLTSDLADNFIGNNKSKAILNHGYDVKISHDVLEQKGSLELFFNEQKKKHSRLKAIIGLSKTGFNKDKSMSLVYVEYYNPQIGLQKKYCLMTWKNERMGLLPESIKWF